MIRTILIPFLMLALFMGAASNGWADDFVFNNSFIQVESNPASDSPGTAVLKTSSGIVDLGEEGHKVTIVVTPETGFVLKRENIVVEKLAPMPTTPARRRVIAGDIFTVNGPTIVKSSSSGEYFFTVPKGYGARVTVTFISQPDDVVFVDNSTSLSSSDLSKTLIITEDVDVSVFSNLQSGEFTGTLEGESKADGTFYTIDMSGQTNALFNKINGGTVKNIVLKNVSISGGTNAGAIANEMIGQSDHIAAIYNCGILSGSVSGDGYVGGLVGLLGSTTENSNCYARVINCYSYAKITGGSEKAGIVGYNSFASKANDIRTMVMNCMFYGDISLGNTIVPIYGGAEISNDYDNKDGFRNNKLNNYNYFLYEVPYSEGRHITKYNCALAAEKRFLIRFEFYRHLLNSTRELAAWYATGIADNGKGIGDDNKMAKWVLDKSIAPYPILKVQGTYPSVVNFDPEYTNDETGAKVLRSSITKRNRGGFIRGENQTAQELTITISNTKTNGGQSWPSSASITTSSLTRKRIDKDTLNFNYNYDKVQLPYYNEVGTGNYTENRAVTGWKIVSMSGGTAGGYSETNYDFPNYNFADRDTYGKDIYTSGTGNSGRVFAQGAYFNVPTGVSSITIEPYWAKAVYLSDACYDRYGYNNSDDLTQVGGGQRYTNNTDCLVLTGNQKVYTKIEDNTNNDGALNSTTLSGVTNPKVYDYAVVLVGNYHHHATLGKTGPELSSGNKPFTIMSIDLNKDNEPDYCLIYRSGKNQPISAIRFDFITVPGMAMAHKMAQANTSSKGRDLGIPGNCCPKGWFEITTTGLIKYGQFEHSVNNKTLAPVIFMGGVIDQFVANNTGTYANYNDKTKYMLFGDNVWFNMLSNGNHMDKSQAMPHRPISLVGGEYGALYLSGYYRPDATACTSGNGDKNAECYIDGGKFGEVAGAGQENVDGNVTWKINHADIRSFFGGGLKVVTGDNPRQITGYISTTIMNSHVDLFCGGPKFGDMTKDNAHPENNYVETVATDCTFGTYFGAGYGGTSIVKFCPKGVKYNQYELKNYNFNSWVNETYDGSSTGYYRGKLTSNGVACGYEYELFAGSGGNVGRLYQKYASFSLAQTNNVSSTLTRCTLTGNFFGGGSLGKVDGTATSKLEGCTVNGNVYGAGYSASIPTASIMATGGFKVNGVAANPNYNESTGVYEKADYPASTDYTWVKDESSSLSNGDQTLSDVNGHTIKTTGEITGLGRVIGKVTLNILGNTVVRGNKIKMDDEGFVVKDDDGNAIVLEANTGGVFGGGDASDAEGDIEVNINTPTQQKEGYNVINVYGGGNNADVYGNTKVNLLNGIINNNVFGGGNNGKVNGSTEVNIEN